MKWKDVLLGAFASLIVTILSGIVVYYATKEPDQKKTEKITYSVEQGASFTGGTQDLAFATVRVQNEGGVAAKRVVLVVTFKTAQVKDFAVEANAGSKEVARELKPKSIGLTYETLLPDETIALNLLLSSAEKLAISVRSDAAFGTAKSPVSATSAAKSKVNEFLELSVPLTGALLVLSTLPIGFFVRRTGLVDNMFSDRNNAGFMLLHHGLIDDAAVVLTNSVHAGHYDALTLSNLAVCKALKGEHDQATQFLRAANFRERHGHVKAVILFNEALISLISGNRDDAKTKLREAIAKSPTHIRRYCQRSVHLDAVRDDPAFVHIIKDA